MTHTATCDVLKHHRCRFELRACMVLRCTEKRGSLLPMALACTATDWCAVNVPDLQKTKKEICAAGTEAQLKTTCACEIKHTLQKMLAQTCSQAHTSHLPTFPSNQTAVYCCSNPLLGHSGNAERCYRAECIPKSKILSTYPNI